MFALAKHFNATIGITDDGHKDTITKYERYEKGY